MSNLENIADMLAPRAGILILVLVATRMFPLRPNVAGLRPQDWTWEGHLDAGASDPLSMPRPTPEDATGPTPLSTPTIAP